MGERPALRLEIFCRSEHAAPVARIAHSPSLNALLQRLVTLVI